MSRLLAPLARHATVALAVCAAAITLPACDFGDDGEDPGAPIEAADAFEDGVSQDTAGGAFRVVLTSRDGLEVGEQSALIARVGFHEPSDPDGPGKGIPGATVQLDAYMPGTGMYVDTIEATYLDDGRYLLEGIELEQAGVWQFEIGIEVGATMDEQVTFAFDIAD